MIAAIPLLTACDPGTSSRAVCQELPVRHYTPDEMRQAAGELDGLPRGAVVPRMMQDYREERAVLRAMCGG